MLVPSRGDILEWFGLWVEVPELAHFLKDGKQTAIGELNFGGGDVISCVASKAEIKSTCRLH